MSNREPSTIDANNRLYSLSGLGLKFNYLSKDNISQKEREEVILIADSCCADCRSLIRGKW
jgi:hypothetical protein